MKIINIGSMNIDRVYEVAHFINPGETIASKKMETYVGGKGLNQSVALASAGAVVFHAGMIGEDGAILLNYLKSHEVDTRFVRTIHGPSGHAIIQVDGEGENGILLYGGANQCITEDFIDEVLNFAEPGDILLLQNEISGMEYILRQAALKGIRIALNPSPIDDKLLSMPLELVTWFILNEIEGRALTGKDQPKDILEAMQMKYPGREVVLTLGSDGVIYGKDGQYVQHGIFKVSAVDTTAAGDTFTGFFLAGILKGFKAEECLRIASVAAALAVSKAGAAPSIPMLQEVINAKLEEVPKNCNR
ncbi:ribokinase [Lacrimispora sp.]|uniref:ribokinase n=1 Tax=Lacrimispora sp. TaxID=2719234 RepID=UPI00289C2062|nr:ribokinase [Lacrimispora sp.]